MEVLGEIAIVIIITVLVLVIFIIPAFKALNSLSESKTVKAASDFVDLKIKKAIKTSQIAVSKSYLTGCSWILVNEEYRDVFYTFRSNEELLITTNGIVEKCPYELIVDNDTILITKNGITEHFFIFNDKDDFLFLRQLSSNEVLFFANQTKYKDELKATLLKIAKEYYREV
ncbi:MAG: hypothetical protein WCY89_01260 [Flavobacteriaceae bacterium]